MSTRTNKFLLLLRRHGRSAVLGAGLVLFLVWGMPAHAQAPDELIRLAEGALNRVFTACSNTKFLECMTVENNGVSLDGFMNRTVNGGTEALDVSVLATGSATLARQNFQRQGESVRQQDTTVQFWATETFGGVPGSTDAGVLAVWLPPNSDKPQADGRGLIVCGTLTITFRIFLTAPLGVVTTDGQALVNATRAQLKDEMEQAGIALVQDGACAAAAPPRKIEPDPNSDRDAVYEGESVKLTGVVWVKNDAGMNVEPLAAKLEITGGPRGADVQGETDASGYFEISYPLLDVTSGDILIQALSPDPEKYTEGYVRVHVDVQKRGTLRIDAVTAPGIIRRGDTLTVKGSVSADGARVPATVSFYSDALPLKSQTVNGDGSYEFSFVPGTEPERSKLGPYLPGVHYILVKATLLGYGEGTASVNYLLQDDVASADNCTPVAVQVLAVQGIANVMPLDEQVLAKQGILSGLAQVNTSTTLAGGMSIHAADGARVALRFDFGDGSDAVIVVNGGGTLKLGRFCKDLDGKVHAALAVENLTQVAANVVNQNPDGGPLDFDLVMPSVSVKSVHTRYLVSVDDAGATTIAALTGNVIVDDRQHVSGIELAEGSVIEVPMGANPAEVAMADVEGELGGTVQAMLDGTFVPPVASTVTAGQALPTGVAGQGVPTDAAFLPTAPALGGGPTPVTVSNSSANSDANALVTRILFERYALPVAVVLGLVVLGSAVIVLRRRGASTGTQVPVPPPTARPPMPTATRSKLPEQKSAPPTTQAASEAFRHAEDEYFRLRGQLSTGRITQADFEARLHDLMVTDAQGRYWLLGADSGKWYVHDGQAWVEGKPE